MTASAYHLFNGGEFIEIKDARNGCTSASFNSTIPSAYKNIRDYINPNIVSGMWLESIPQIITFTAVFFPLVTQLGVAPIVFGTFTGMTCEIGFLTPPVGVNLFAAARISKASIEQISMGVLPLLIPHAVMMPLRVRVSDRVIRLPDLVYGSRR